jgi:hypothetical protein
MHFIGEPGVHLIVGFEAQSRREEALAHQPDLVLDLALLPARCRRAGDRIDEIMAAHLQEAAIVDVCATGEQPSWSLPRPCWDRYAFALPPLQMPPSWPARLRQCFHAEIGDDHDAQLVQITVTVF